MWDENWTRKGLCRDDPPDAMFVKGAEQNKAKVLCGNCPVRMECLAEALDEQIDHGVWGGMTERERRALLRKTSAPSWRAILEATRDAEIAAAAPEVVEIPAVETAVA
jgi:WhiB family redox-sensing transcriptional regulator